MYKTIKSMGQALSEARAYRDPKDEINENFDYAIIDGDNKIIGLYKGQDGKKHAQMNMKGAETQVGVKKPVKIVPVRPNSKTKGDTVIGIGEETITEIRKASLQFSLGMNSDMMRAKKDLEKLGHKVTTNNNKMTVTAKSGSDINRELNDIRNFYDRGVEITAENFEESVELEEETYQLTERDLLKLINKTGFSKADFKTNENDNDHSLNAIMLARAFGTPQEFKDMINIDKRHKERGSINEPDYQKRNALVKKYYPRLK